MRWDTWVSLANQDAREVGNFYRVGVMIDDKLRLWRRVWEGYRP